MSKDLSAKYYQITKKKNIKKVLRKISKSFLRRKRKKRLNEV